MKTSIEERSDTELIIAAREGEIAAFGELVRRHQAPALRVATMALGRSADADDVAQEAFVKAHAALDRFRTDAAFRPWLFRIVVNTARNRHRRSLRQGRLVQRLGGELEQAHPPPDEIATSRTDHRAVIDAINRLSHADRLILTYRWYEQLTEAEIAVALGCRRGTVKSRLNRAMKRLRRELGVDTEATGAGTGPKT